MSKNGVITTHLCMTCQKANLCLYKVTQAHCNVSACTAYLGPHQSQRMVLEIV